MSGRMPDPAETVRQLQRDLENVNDSIAESRALIERSRDLREGTDDGGGADGASPPGGR